MSYRTRRFLNPVNAKGLKMVVHPPTYPGGSNAQKFATTKQVPLREMELGPCENTAHPPTLK
jgi:hypothetical protein